MIFDLNSYLSFALYSINEFLDRALEKIQKNSTYCLETMVQDFETMQSLEDFVTTTPVKRKRKATPLQKPKKKKLKVKLEPREAPVQQPVMIGIF